jgi:hypothetical protein
MFSLFAFLSCALLSEPGPTDGATTEIKYVTREDALREFTIERESRQLQWFEDWQLNPDYSFLLTLHGRNTQLKTPRNDAFFRIYIKLAKGYTLVGELKSEGWFENKAVFWWTQPIPPNEEITLIWIQDRMSGTGHNTIEHLYTFAELPAARELEEAADLAAVVPHVVQKVKYVFPPAPLEVKLKEGQGFWKGPFTYFGSNGLYFTDRVYNKDDANCCPSGDEIFGTFKLVKEKLPESKSYGPIKVSYAYRIETDSVRQAPPKLEDN